MTDFFAIRKEELVTTLVVIFVLLLVRFVLRQVIKKVGKLGELNRNRTVLIVKYVDIIVLCALILSGIFIWGLNFREIGLVMSSVFAVIGVALFANWSILSNITAGVILFFSFPFKIGDKIRIQDKDFPEDAWIEDIKAFHIHLRTDKDELVTYPNNLLLQKGILVLNKNSRTKE